jgi:hypothetical protein
MKFGMSSAKSATQSGIPFEHSTVASIVHHAGQRVGSYHTRSYNLRQKKVVEDLSVISLSKLA